MSQFWVMLLASDDPHMTLFGLAIAGLLPIALAVGCVLLAIWLEGHPKYAPLCALLLAAIIGWASWHWYLTLPLRNPPPLVQGYDLRGHTQLGRPDLAQSERFTKILLQRFPAGTSVADLTAELKRERFDGWGRSKWGGDLREYTWRDRRCHYSLRVHWRTDPDGAATSLQGEVPGPWCDVNKK
jgi:hypothetical protein